MALEAGARHRDWREDVRLGLWDGAKTRRLTRGAYPALRLADARSAADRRRADVAKDEEPQTPKMLAGDAMTFDRHKKRPALRRGRRGPGARVPEMGGKSDYRALCREGSSPQVDCQIIGLTGEI